MLISLFTNVIRRKTENDVQLDITATKQWPSFKQPATL